MTWCIAMRRGKRRRLALTEMAALLEGCKASVRAKVEHSSSTSRGCVATGRCVTEGWGRMRTGWPFYLDSSTC